MLLLVIQAALGACGPDALDNQAFLAGVEGAWERFAGGDRDGYRTRMFELEAAIGCLPAPLDPSGASRYHRNRALLSSLSGDPDGAAAAAAAAIRLAPGEAADWARSVDAWGALLGSAPTSAPVDAFPTSLAARVWTDGRAAAERHAGQPVLVQLFSPQGPPIGGAWIDARAPMPDWVAYPTVDCGGATVPVDRLVVDVEVAESAFAALDVDGFEAALQRVALGLPCVDRPIRSAQAAAIHRLEGIRLFTTGARLPALRSFQQAQLLDPVFEPPPTLIQPDSTLEALWRRAATAGSPPWIDVDVPEGVSIRVDGIAAAVRPSTLPGIVQALSPSERVLWTRYVPAGAALPDLAWTAREAAADADAALPPALALYRKDERAQARSNLRRGLEVGGAGLLIGSAAFYGLNARAAGRYRDPTTAPERLPDLRAAANRSATASVGLLIAGGASLGYSLTIR